jgi:hypothetical protein
MSNLVYDLILKQSSGDRKRTPGGWTSFNGPCCIHNGQSRPDTKKRAGIKMIDDGGVIYSCFNCKFKSGWSPGRGLSQKTEFLLQWLGVQEEELRKLKFKIWQMQERIKADLPVEKTWTKLAFTKRKLPDGAKPLREWIEEGCQDPNFIQTLEYLAGRGDEILTSLEYYWTPARKDDLNRRIIIPFKWQEEIIGWTARAIFSSRWRYFTETQPHYMFNTENIKEGWMYLFITEGPFDAISINGIAMLGDHMDSEQISWINQSGLIPVIVPDRVEEGGTLVDTAIREGWHVSFPKWDKGIKDAADAVRQYGRLYTIWTIIDAKTNNRLQINIERKRLK